MASRETFRKVRMGMVGGGQDAFIGGVHRMAAALDGKIELVCGAFSRSFENCQQTGTQLGLSDDRLYASVEDMIAAEAERPADERMELLSIVTPNHLHVPAARAALAAGIHVISDKPAGISLAEVAALGDEIAATTCLYGLTHTYLGYPMVWEARHLVRSGALGRIRKILVQYPQGWLAQPIETSQQKQALWRTDPALAGPAGCMGDIGSHAHSLAEFVCDDEMVDLAAHLGTHFDNRQLDDDGTVLFKMASGASGTLIASQVCAGEENALSIRVYGETGGLEWHQMRPNSLLEHSATASKREHRAGTDRPLSAEALAHCRLPAGHPEGYIEAFANLYRHFALAIRAGQQHTADFVPSIAEAVRGMRFLEAVVASHNQGGVWIDCKQGISPSSTHMTKEL